MKPLERVNWNETRNRVLEWVKPGTWLQAPLISTNWNGDARSTTAKTKIDLSSEFGVPAGVTAVYVRLYVRDSGSAGASNLYFGLSPNDTDASLTLAPRPNHITNDDVLEAAGVVPCNADGDIYYQCVASGAGTMDVWIEIWGYEGSGAAINSTASSIFGSSPNYAMFGADGTLTLHGTATVWDDVVVNLSNIKAPASDPPTWRSYKGCEVPAFGASGKNTLYFTCQIPHKYKLASDINFHFHAAYPNANAGNSRWQFTYSWANIAGTFATETTVLATFAAPGVADNHALHSFGTISGTGKGMSSVLLCSLTRLGADGADTYGSDIYALSADFHIEFDALGSSQELVK
jgi:hypothetical protein